MPTPTSLDVPAYLGRLGYAGALAPTASTLGALQLAHLYAVPFENLDIHLGRPLRLERPALFDKIVARRRGGFCYELNGLFAALLEALGFSVTYLSARVANGDGTFGPEFDHLALLVEPAPGERWLADVGFGDGFLQPLRLAPGLEHLQGQWTYGLDERDGGYQLWRRDAAGVVEPQYAFILQPRRFPADYAAMCVWQATAPESHFVQHRLCTLATPAGWLTLSDRRWIVTEGGQRHETAIDEAEFWRRVQTDFGMPLTPEGQKA
jgi:N-hydroxyarylamine O-acetyltransferase